VPAKGFDALIEACRRAREAGLAFTLTIHGEGPLEAGLRMQIAAAGLADRVTLAGYADLAPARAAADLFVLASRREGFGNVLVEAMAAGLPVLATRAGGPETFIADGRNGFLVAPDDPAALAAALVALADAGRRRAVIPAALETARGFTVAASTAQLELALARVATGRSTPA
jgi:glycosyltransferase involved in cell wall biosynthesis